MENYATILLNKEQKPIGYLYTDIDDMEEDGLLIKTKTFMKEYNSFVSYKNNKKPDKKYQYKKDFNGAKKEPKKTSNNDGSLLHKLWSKILD